MLASFPNKVIAAVSVELEAMDQQPSSLCQSLKNVAQLNFCFKQPESDLVQQKRFFFGRDGRLIFKRKIGQFVRLLEFRLSISYSSYPSSFLQKDGHKYA